MSQVKSEKDFLENERTKLGLENVKLVGHDRVKEFMSMGWDEVRALTIDELRGFADTLSGYNLYLRSELGKYRALKLATEKKLERNLFFLSTGIDAQSLNERRSVALHDNKNLRDLSDENTNYSMLVEQLDTFVWGLETRIKRIEDNIKWRATNGRD